jgi:hypothetical protein
MRLGNIRRWFAVVIAPAALIAAAAVPASASSLDVTFSVTSVNFGSVTIGTTASGQAVVTNSSAVPLFLGSANLEGGAPGDFSLATSGCVGAIDAGSSCNLAVWFTPKTTGLRTTSLWVTLNAHNSSGGTIAHATVAASLTGLGVAPSITLSDASAGSVTVGSSGTADATLTNNSLVPVTVSNSSLAGVAHHDFAISSVACTNPLEPGQSCDIVVVFTPATTGDASATLNVAVDVFGTPGPTALSAQSTVSGTGVSSGATPAAALSSLNFGQVTLGTSAVGEVTLTDTGANPITFKKSGVSGNAYKEFVVSTTGCASELTTGQSCSLSVTFTPAYARLRSATLGVQVVVHGTSKTAATATGALSGSGVKPTVSLTSAGGGAVTVGASTSVSLTVTNSSLVPMTYHRTTLAGPHLPSWSVANTTCAGALAAGASCEVDFNFAPHAQGDLTVQVASILTIGAGKRTVYITGTTNMSGTGVEPTFTVSTGTFGPTAKGDPVSGTATITNTSDVALSYKASAFGGTNPKDFSVIGTTCTSALLPSDSCTLTIRFDPNQTGSGSRSAVLAVVMTVDGITPEHNVSLATKVTGTES